MRRCLGSPQNIDFQSVTLMKHGEGACVATILTMSSTDVLVITWQCGNAAHFALTVGGRRKLTDDFLDDFRILKLDVPQERQDVVDDGRPVQSIDDLVQTGQDVERQFQVARVALEHHFRLGQHHLTDHLVVQRSGDFRHRHQCCTLSKQNVPLLR